MQDQSVIHSTFVIERSYPKPPEQVFSAFADAAKKRRWFAEASTQDLEQFDMDFRVGGVERVVSRMNSSTPFPGVVLSNEGNYLDIIPNQRIVTAARMALGDKRISAALVTFEFIPTDQGTNLICTHQGAFFEGSDGPQRREGGWQKLFDRLGSSL